FFLVTIGMQVDLRIFLSPSAVALAGVVSALAIATKLIGCGLASARMGRRRAFQIGVGMIPRGEVSVIVAQLGLATGAISATIYAVVLTMVVATTLIAPVFIKPAFKNERVSPTPEPSLDLSGVSEFSEA